MINKEIIINSSSVGKLIDFKELWKFRELFIVFSWRNIQIRYRQTVLGILWVILQPLLTSGVFTIIFGKLAKIPSGELPYSLFVLSGMVFWTFFSNSLSQASESLVSNQNIIKKIYFPKMILLLSSIFTNFIDFLINFIMLIIVAVLFGYIPNITIFIIFPVTVLVTILSAFGLSLIFSSLNVKYRDVRYALPFFFQILIFLAPVIYPLDIVGERNRYLMAINPITSVITLARSVFVKNAQLDYSLIAISSISLLMIMYFGLWYFKKTEKFIADIV